MAFSFAPRPHPLNPRLPAFAERPLRVLVTGGTGFIGKPLVSALRAQGHEVIVLTRNRQLAGSQDGLRYVNRLADIALETKIDLLINLAGEPLAAGRWNAQRKQAFRRSRIDTTLELLNFCATLQTKPQTLISGSAIGFYGARGEQYLDEESAVGSGFSAQLCSDWEQAAEKFEALGMRVALLRTGIVLGNSGGSFPKLKQSFSLGVSSYLGSGKQYLSWIHLDDLIGIIAWISRHAELQGAFNGTAPAPLTHREFALDMERQKKTLFRMAVPGFALRLMMGEMADELLLSGQRVLPKRIQQAGYVFLFPELGQALADLLKK